MVRRNWTREELLIAFGLYCRIPFAKLVSSNPLIIETSALLGRSPSALSMKLGNFARLDPAIQARGLSGLAHGGKGEVELWEEFGHNTEALAFESESALRNLKGIDLSTSESFPTGPTDAERSVRVRLVQSFFRKSVLSSYNFTCSFCNIEIRQILIASHIIPWSADVERRADPRNGICLCAFHDRAFDRGVLSVGSSLEILVSGQLSYSSSNEMTRVGITDLAGRPIRSAERFQADPAAFEFHRTNVFMQ